MLSVELFRVLLDDLFEGVYFVDLDGRIVYWNKAAERITGYRGSEIMGRRCSDGILCHVERSWSATPLSMLSPSCPTAATWNETSRSNWKR